MALGVAVIVFMSSLIYGLQGSIIWRTLDYQAQIIILPTEEVARSLRQTETNQANSAILIQPRAQRLRSVDQWQKVRIMVL